MCRSLSWNVERAGTILGMQFKSNLINHLLGSQFFDITETPSIHQLKDSGAGMQFDVHNNVFIGA